MVQPASALTSSDTTRYWLSARVSSADLPAVKAVLTELLPSDHVREEGDDLLLETELEGASAQDLNRFLLSAMRKVEKKTRLRAQWTAEGTTQSFFDYVLKKTTTS